MIDLETLSTNPNAVILTLGAVKFNPFGTGQSDPMYFKMDVDSQTKLGRHVQPETLDWWATQPKKIQEEALGESDRISIEETLKKINKYSVFNFY